MDALIGHPGSVTSVHRSCTARDLPPIAEVSTWADDVRGAPPPLGRPETAPWHFIDIPRGVSEGSAKRFCPADGCVVSAIESERRVLANGRVGTHRRAEALMFVIHLVADLHQPLHTATNHDRGGNCVPVDFFRRVARPDQHAGHGTWHPNLHRVWDTDILERAMGPVPIVAYAARLDTGFSAEFAAWQSGTVEEWAWETHRLAETVAYGRLPEPLPVVSGDVARCDEQGTDTRWRRYRLRLGSPYQNVAADTLDRQLARAGVRLARVLNRALAQ